MSAETHADDTDEQETYTIKSYYRPLTRAARKDLKQYDIHEEVSGDDVDGDAYTVVEVAERPEEEILERHELRLVEEPLEVWQNERREVTRIYEDWAETQGREMSMDVEEVREQVRERDEFSRIE